MQGGIARIRPIMKVEEKRQGLIIINDSFQNGKKSIAVWMGKKN